jgi:hemerythrin
MQSFTWDARFDTGIGSVDEQHQQLVVLINRCGTLLAEKASPFAEVEGLFLELFKYARHHFADEEALMAQAGLDPRHQSHHQGAHADFLEHVLTLHAEVSEDNPDAAVRLVDFLVRWLIYHILGEDQEMADQIAQVEAGQSPADAYEAAHRRRDETAEPLLGALRAVFTEVSARNRELRDLNNSLEARVAERTRELRAANARLEVLSLSDVLTGLPNRRHAMRSLSKLWDESDTNATPLGCLMVDVDGLKGVNDGHGHAAGDAVLQALGHALQDTLRTDDVVCRLGGDEFLVICPNTNRAGLLKIAEQMLTVVRALHVPIGTAHWDGSISVGAAQRAPGMASYEALIEAADRGAYKAKADGRDCVREAD